MNTTVCYTLNKHSLHDLHAAILHWYDTYGRKTLPWRTTHDPYHVYVSEVMLQQTQVKTILERFYQPFLTTFPTLTSLANAQLQDILNQWQGMGYYRRAKHLHLAAKQTAPHLPHTFDELIKLPGIGKNTARAILAFGYHQPVAILEANVKRILYRFFAWEEASEKILWQHADYLLNHHHPFDHNQAMMDIGATICTIKNPRCAICPLSMGCAGKATPESYPRPKTKKDVPTRTKHLVMFSHPDKGYLLYKRHTDFLHGLYGFIQYDSKPTHLSHYKKLGSVNHVYSHFKLKATVYISAVSDSFHPDLPQGEWFHHASLPSIPTSEVDKKVIRQYLHQDNILIVNEVAGNFIHDQ